MTAPDMPEPWSQTRPREWWHRLTDAHRSGERGERLADAMRVALERRYADGYADAKRDTLDGQVACAISGAIVGAVLLLVAQYAGWLS